MTEDRSADKQAIRRSRRKLSIILLIPILAIGSAYLVFYTGLGIPRGTTNRGELLDPPLQLAGLGLRDQMGAALPAAALRGNWSILLPGPSSCDDACAERLWLTRQLRKALGKDIDRVNRIYLALDGAVDQSLQRLLATEHPDVMQLGLDAVAWTRFLATSNAPSPAAMPFFLVDQRGFLMMYYTLEHDGQDTLKDLRFLLKYSPEH